MGIMQQKILESIRYMKNQKYNSKSREIVRQNATEMSCLLFYYLFPMHLDIHYFDIIIHWS